MCSRKCVQSGFVLISVHSCHHSSYHVRSRYKKMHQTTCPAAFSVSHPTIPMDEPLCSPSTRSFTTHLAKFKYETRSSPTKPTHSLPSTPLRTSSRSSPRRIKLNSSPISPYFRPPVSSITSAKVELEVPDVKGKKKKKSARPFAHPSVYAHLDVLPDYTTKGLNLLMCGINPGVKSAETGCHCTLLHSLLFRAELILLCGETDANPSNHYYKCLYGAGLTDKKLTPEEGRHLPQLYGIGNTNLVSRPSAEVRI